MKTPEHCSTEEINALVEKELLPARAFATAMDAVDKLLSAKKRHRPDIYECRKCGYQFPQEAACPECNSGDMFLFMRAPSRSEVRRTSGDIEEQLTELDPDWRERFGGDEERAWDFYKPKPRPTRVIHTSRFEPDDYASRPEPEPDHGDEPDFDTDLEPRLSDD